MTARVAINGFGRIGRLCLRAMLERHKKNLSLVAVNDIADLETNAHLFQYDSTYGVFPGKLRIGEGTLSVLSDTVSPMKGGRGQFACSDCSWRLSSAG